MVRKEINDMSLQPPLQFYSQPSLLIQNCRILDPAHDRDEMGDLLIEEGKIAAIDYPGRIPVHRAASVLCIPDSQNQETWVVPGLIDVHVHLREPGFESKETIATGTQAAVAGGFTSVACMANTQPVNDHGVVTAFIREQARKHACCRVFPIGAVSKGLQGQSLAEIGGMVKEGACALSDDGKPVMNAYLMRTAMDYAKAFGVPIISHAEDCHLVGSGAMHEGVLSHHLGLCGVPAAAEEVMIAREIALCRLTLASVHIAHVSTAEGVEHIRRAKEAGLPITAEVTPHHLMLTEECLKDYDSAFKMSPPLRSERDRNALRKGLVEQVIDLIATDHAPHALWDKAVEFDQAANGILGLQTAVPLTLQLVREGMLSPLQWLAAFTIAPARLLKLSYGTLGIGQAADLTLIQPHRTWTFSEDLIFSKSRNTPFLNWNFQGKVMACIVDGKIVYREGLRRP